MKKIGKVKKRRGLGKKEEWLGAERREVTRVATLSTTADLGRAGFVVRRW